VIDVSVSQTDQTFTVNGNAYSGVEYILVNGYGGDDYISVVSLDGSGIISSSISGGEGNDDITLNFDGGVWAGVGDDSLHLSDAFRGTACGEEGNDSVYVSGACIDPEINGGDGDDLIDCSRNSYRVEVRGGEGNDTIFGSLYEDDLYGGGGDDVFYAMDGAADHIVGGAGFDVAQADNADVCSGVEQIFGW
jgi:Ca2+-binding RTX toxin-like protein